MNLSVNEISRLIHEFAVYTYGNPPYPKWNDDMVIEFVQWLLVEPPPATAKAVASAARNAEIARKMATDKRVIEKVQASLDSDKHRALTPPAAAKINSCNRHSDCKAAEADLLARHPDKIPADIHFTFHCTSDDCEDCFGN